MNNNQPSNTNQLNIELPEELAEGIYSNLVVVSHSPSEFVLDFITVTPNTPKSKVRSRVIVSPQNLKKFLSALAENINIYERQYGQIKVHDEIAIPINLSGKTPQA